ncbi:MAG TPA: DUF1508 domain-containing protein [Pyrinomonadaceae bacterium]|jgi:uncharacterized protein YegP (UPF0339 family)|nr:DUF1508 domain-containing protein [Pyrinomonadaceae bacterium]
MKFQIYQDHKNEWRWRLRAANGRIVADSAEGYNSKQHCKDDIELVQRSATATVVED